MKDLDKWILDDLRKSGITDRKMIRRLGLRSMSKSEMRSLTKSRDASEAYAIPHINPDTDETKYRYKLRKPKSYTEHGKKKSQKYWQKTGSKPVLYVPPGVDPYDYSETRYIVEGEKKAILLASLGYCAVAIGGVWMFKSKKHQIALLDSLKTLAAAGDVVIAFDGNVATNPSVAAARRDLALKLKNAGKARIFLLTIPRPVNLDDFVVDDGQEAFDKIPRVPIDPKDQILAARAVKGIDARQRKDAIASIVTEDMKTSGQFFRTPGDPHPLPLYFSRDGSRPIDLDNPKDAALRAFILNRYGVNPAEQEYLFVYEHLLTEAMLRGKDVDPRTFATFKGTGVLYITASETKMFRVTPEGFRLVPNGHNGVILRAPSRMQPITLAEDEPSREAFDYLLSLPNIVDGEHATAKQMRLLLEMWTWACLVGTDILPTRPIVLTHGEPGSGKTTGARALQMSMFGDAADVLTFNPRKMDGVDAVLGTQHLAVLDNVDGKFQELADRLRIAATGGTLALRTLWKTNAATYVPIRAFVSITSKNPRSFTENDMVDRLLYIGVARLKKNKQEERIKSAIKQQRPALWSYWLSVLPDIVGALRERKAAALEFRMADFASFAMTIAPVLGYERKEVLEALRAGEKEKTAFVAQVSDLPTDLAALVDLNLMDDDFFKDSHTASELLRMLSGRAPYDRMHPTTLGQRISEDFAAIQTRVAITQVEDKHTKSKRYRFQRPARRSRE